MQGRGPSGFGPSLTPSSAQISTKAMMARMMAVAATSICHCGGLPRGLIPVAERLETTFVHQAERSRCRDFCRDSWPRCRRRSDAT